jgi:hypothetical protein
MLEIEPPVYNLAGRSTAVMNVERSYRSEDEISASSTMKPQSHKSSNANNKERSNQAAAEEDDFIELGLLEKEFKKFYHIKDNQSVESGSLTDVFSTLRNRVKIKLNNERYLSDKHLVSDIRNRDESLEEVLRYLYVMHLIEYGYQNTEERKERPEDEAISRVIQSLGFFAKNCQNMSSKVIKKPPVLEEDQQEVPDCLYRFEYESVSGMKLTTDVFSMNIFSQSRGRRSMIINGTPADNDPYLLVTFGTEKALRHLIRPVAK